MANQQQIDEARERLSIEKKIADVAKEINELKEQSAKAEEKEQKAIEQKRAKAQKYLDQLTEGRKTYEDIEKTTEKSIGNIGRMATAEYDISEAKRKQNAYQKEIEKIDKSKGIYTEKEKKNLITILESQKEILGTNIGLAKSAKDQLDASDQLLGVLGFSVSRLKDMKKQAALFVRVLSKNPLFMILVAATALAASFLDSVRHTRELSKNLNVSLVTAQKLSRELKGATFSFGFIAEQFKKLSEGDFAGIAKDFVDAGKNLALGVSESDIVEAMNTMKSLEGRILSKDEAVRIAQSAKTLGMTSGTMTNVAKQMQLAGSGANDITEALKQVEGLAIDMGALEVDNVKDIEGIMKDIANNTEAFAAYGKDGGANMIKAAAHARKLGLELGSMVKISDSLLDFESSIEKEMEASLMIGKQLNYDRARALALEGDMAGAAREVANQVGGLGGFNRMNVLQKRAMAESVGLGVSEFQKLLGGGGETEDPVIKSQDELKGSIDKLTEAMGKATMQTGKDLLAGTAALGVAGFAGFKGVKAVAGSKVGQKVLGGIPGLKNLAGAGSKTAKNLPEKQVLTKSGRPDMRFKVNKDLAKEGAKEVAQEAMEKKIKEEAMETGAKKGVGFFGKMFGKGAGKTAVKKIPILGLLAGGLFAGQRALKGDFAGAALELLSGGASLIPGVGTGASMAIDAGLLMRDLNKMEDPEVKNEFADLSAEQQRQVEQVQSMNLSNQELIETLKLMNENNETQMAEYIAVLQTIAANTAQTATNVDGITNN